MLLPIYMTKGGLSQFSFNDFYSEETLDEIKKNHAYLYAILGIRDLNATQLQKLSFLIFADENILLPFKFSKDNYGPFSRELNNNLICHIHKLI